MNTHWLFQSSSLEGLKIGTDERRYFVALHPKTGKAIIPERVDTLKNLILNNTVEIKDDRR